MVVIEEEGEDGNKVVGRGEDMVGVEAEVEREVGEEWIGVAGDLRTEDGGEVGWKEEAGVHKGVTWAGEGGAEGAWREVWRVEEEAGADLDEELPWIEEDGVETGVEVEDSQEVEGEDLTPLYHCSTISRRCQIPMEEIKSRKHLEMMKMMTRILLRLGGERKVRTVVLEGGGVEEGVGEWKQLVQVGAIGVVQEEEIGEVEEEVEGVLEE